MWRRGMTACKQRTCHGSQGTPTPQSASAHTQAPGPSLENARSRSVRNPKPLPANNTPEQRNRPLRALCRAAPLPPVWHNVGHPWEA
jgi:hypothetical protein